MKHALEELSFLLEDIALLVWWLIRAFVFVLAMSVGVLAAFGIGGWLLQQLAGIL